MFAKSRLLIALFVCSLLLLVTSLTLADTTLASSFTYQGNLADVNGPVNNLCDFQFSLFTLSSGGSQISSTQSKTNVSVSNGMFNTVLDFGASAFDGQDRYLQIAVRCPAGSGGYTTLSPRQAVTPAPYAQYAQGAAWSGLSGIPTNLTTLGNLNCATNQIPKWNSTTWACAADNTGTASSFWSLTGNAGTTTSNFIGTTDQTPLEFRVNNQLALRIYPFPNAPNIIAGSHWNNIGQLGSSGGNTIGGGGAELGGNTISGSFNTIGGGYDNEIKPENYNTIGGGGGNQINGGSHSVISGGLLNTTNAENATIPGGYFNTVIGDNSFAAGYMARANHNNSFIWSDGDLTGSFSTTATNQFAIHASGGIRMVTASDAQGVDSVGCFINAGQGTWSCTSDRNSKQDFADVDTHAILEGVASLPITSWAYLDTTTRHIGPTAQDFYAAFNIGENEKTITSVDADGIALASIQALYEIVQEKETELADLTARVEQLEAQLAPSSASTAGVSDTWMMISIALVCTLGGVIIGGRRGKAAA